MSHGTFEKSLLLMGMVAVAGHAGCASPSLLKFGNLASRHDKAVAESDDLAAYRKTIPDPAPSTADAGRVETASWPKSYSFGGGALRSGCYT